MAPLTSPEKKEDIASLEKASVEVTEKVVLEFGGDSSLPPPPVLTVEEEKRLYRKIDLRLMPMLSLMYLCSFLDRGMFCYGLEFGFNDERIGEQGISVCVLVFVQGKV